jgi:hypothetical protein
MAVIHVVLQLQRIEPPPLLAHNIRRSAKVVRPPQRY